MSNQVTENVAKALYRDEYIIMNALACPTMHSPLEAATGIVCRTACLKEPLFQITELTARELILLMIKGVIVGR